MISAERDTWIDTSPSEVFELVDEPTNLVKFVPSLLDVSRVERHDDGVAQARYSYQLAGVRLSGTLCDAERDPPRTVIRKLSGALDGWIRYRSERERDGTRATCAFEYELPEPVRDSIPEPLARTYTEQEVLALASNLKAHLEAGPS